MTKQSSPWVVEVKNLSKTFDHTRVINDINLQIKKGEIFGFIGPNGSGKTTLIRMLCGLLTPDGGEGHCLGHDIITETEAIKLHSSYLSQVFGLYNNLTIQENLELMAGLYNLKNRRQRIQALADELDLTPFMRHITSTLSGGWKHRLSIAAALIHNPDLLLLDEPTASIDPLWRQNFWMLLHELSERGITVIVSSQNMDEVERCDRIIYLNKGRSMAIGSVTDIIQSSNLKTWSVKGEKLFSLATDLKKLPSIEQVLTFYGALHVSGFNILAMQQDLAPYFADKNYIWNHITPTLGDIFILLAKERG